MDCYFGRITLTTVSMTDIKRMLKKTSPKYFYCIEGLGTENPHCHFYIETPDNNKTIRSRIVAIGAKGSGKYQLKQTEAFPLRALAYMLKENKYRFKGNWTEGEIDTIIKFNDEVKNEIKLKKDKKKTMLQTLIQYVKETYPNYLNFLETDIATKIIDYHIQNEMLVCAPRIKTYADTLYLLFHPTSSQDYSYKVYNII